MARTLRGFDEEFPYDEEFDDNGPEFFGNMIGDQVAAEMFGTISVPEGFELGSAGELRRKETRETPTGARAAANALTAHIQRTYGRSVGINRPTWASGTTFTVQSLGKTYERGMDGVTARIAKAYNTNAFRVQPKQGGDVFYTFTDNPYSAPTWARIFGMTVQPVNRTV